MRKKIKNISDLKEEKAFIAGQITIKEKEIYEKLVYFEQNAGIIILKSFVPNAIKGVNFFDESDKLMELIHWIYPSFTEKAEKHKWMKSIPYALNMLIKFITKSK